MGLNRLRKFFNRSAWVLTTLFIGVMMAIVIIGQIVAGGYQAALNSVFKTNPYQKIDDGTGGDNQYFKSDFLNADKQNDDNAMRQNSKTIARQAAVEGTVLLWNDNEALPLKDSAKVGLFGNDIKKYIYSGNGSGYVQVKPRGENSSVDFADELKNYGIQIGNQDDYGQNLDTAIYTISRNAGEHYDKNFGTADFDYDYDVSTTDDENLKKLKAAKQAGNIKSIVVIINSGGAMQFKHLYKDYDIDACIYAGEGGTMSMPALADVLTNKGKYYVSGRLSDTYVFDNKSHASSMNFGGAEYSEYSKDIFDPATQTEPKAWEYGTYDTKYVAYQEGIYVGYRYFETRYEDSVLGNGNAKGSKGAYMGSTWDYKNEVAFSFGSGLTYTTFAHSNYKVEEDETGYNVSITSRNTGKYASKDVLEVYVQKPYTDYDKQNGIEKASVELVGFEKSDVIKPGESATISTHINKEELKTYDANNKKTYILEKGDYYLAFGNSAHDALNNILAGKGKTVADGMTYDGDSSLAHKITIENDDFETYSKSLTTGKQITNQFDDADLNKYSGTADQKITYLSRNDWEGTYPSPVILKATNEQMVKDLQHGQKVEPLPEDKMPVYGKTTSPMGTLTLAMMMDKDFDDPLWEDLLNQTTLEEQQFLISYGLGYLAAVESVAAPGILSKDGPQGIKQANTTTTELMAFPCAVIQACTYDKALIEEVGKAFSHEILHAGYTGIYGPGAGIHRNPNGGRNFEYYSEDGVLSSLILKSQVIGLQSKGVIVFTKHFALNDQETYRYGIATFANEQSIREIYLRAFETAVREGKMNGVMSSFNRIGLNWAGSHKGLLTEVLRSEWGFNGIVETDSCFGSATLPDRNGVLHMTSQNAIAQGLLAGNDVWMCGGGDQHFIKSEYTSNPTVMQALRRATKRILYIQLHSNAMNGISSSTRIIRVQTWWEAALDVAKYTLIGLTCLSFVMTVLAFYFSSSHFGKLYKEKVFRQNLYQAALEEHGRKPFWTKRKRQVATYSFVTLASLSVLAGVLTPALTTYYKYAPTFKTNINKPVEVEDERIKGKTPYVLEAESAKLIAGDKGSLSVNEKGDVKWVEKMNENRNSKLEFDFTSPVEEKVALSVRVNPRIVDTVFTDNVKILVNGEEFTSDVVIKANGSKAETWYQFKDYILGEINIKAGQNKIEFITKTSDNLGSYNFDNITIYSKDNILWVCKYLCPECGKCIDEHCPNIGKEGHEVCEVINGKTLRYEAENSTLKGGTRGALKTNEKSSGDPSTPIVGNLDGNKGASLTFEINSPSKQRGNFKLAINKGETPVLWDVLGFSLNGKDLQRRENTAPGGLVNNNPQWFVFEEVNLGCIDFEKGLNTLTITVLKSETMTARFNLDYALFTAEDDLTISNRKVTGISITKNPSKLEYDEGDVFDPTGIEIQANYDDGTSEVIKDYTYSVNSPLTKNDTKVTFSYLGFTASLDITVKEKELIKYVYEAEEAKLTNGTSSLSVKPGCVDGFNNNKGASIQFEVNSLEDTKGTIFANVSQQKTQLNFNDVFEIETNGNKLETNSIVPACSTDSKYYQWFSWTTVMIGQVDLNKGINTIKFVSTGLKDSGLNFNYLMIQTQSTKLEEDLSSHKCDVCGKCIFPDCPATSCKDKCTSSEAEHSYGYDDMTFTAGKKGNFKKEGNGAIGAVYEKLGGAMAFKFNSSKDTTAHLKISMSLRNQPVFLKNSYKITVNDQVYETKAIRPSYTESQTEWTAFFDIDIGCINIKSGENTIKLEVISNAIRAGSNIMAFKLYSDSIS